MSADRKDDETGRAIAALVPRSSSARIGEAREDGTVVVSLTFCMNRDDVSGIARAISKEQIVRGVTSLSKKAEREKQREKQRGRKAEESANRYHLAAELRRAGATFREIGERLGGVSVQRARQMVAQEWRAHVSEAYATDAAINEERERNTPERLAMEARFGHKPQLLAAIEGFIPRRGSR